MQHSNICLTEHEIAGDILLELDVNTLKELDLPAFGRRMHIFNGIKELRRQVEGPASLNTSYLRSSYQPISPSVSGYEPDTPSTRAAFSPQQTFSPSQFQMLGYGQTGMFSPSQVLLSPEISPLDTTNPGATKYLSERTQEPSRTSGESARLRGLGFAGDSPGHVDAEAESAVTQSMSRAATTVRISQTY